MKEILNKLASHTDLTREETHNIMLNITRGAYSDIQIAAFLSMIQMRGVKVDELLGLRDGLLETGLTVDFAPFDVIDIVGTGGDGKNTFNISTCACFVVAGAGYKVAKHGNYAASSVSGASNVLEHLGAKFSNDPDKLKRSLDDSNMAYLHAPLFAKGMKNVAPVRKALQIATCFNLLGPLINPCRPKYQLLGVATLNQVRLYNSVNQKLDVEYGIVNSISGYDEISLTSDFKMVTRQKENIFSPAQLQLPVAEASDIYGGSTLAEAAQIFMNVMNNTASTSQKNVVIANAAFAISIMEPQKDIMECLALARESLESGRARQALNMFISRNS